MSVHVRRRLVALVVLAAIVAGVVPLLTGGGDPALPEAGSSFGSAPQDRDRDTSLLSALAPLLSGDAPGSADGAGGTRGGGSTPGSVTAAARGQGGSNLGIPIDRAAARLFMVGFPGTAADAAFFERLRVREWGAVVVSGGNYVDAVQLAALTGEMGVVARNAGHLAPIVAARQPGGEGSAFADVPPADPAGLETAGDVGREARKAGATLRALGVTMNLAPDADLGSAGGAWEGRAFGAEPGPVGAKVRAALDAYRATKVIASVGHFPGEGAASGDPASGAATVGLGLEELRANDLRPFARLAGRAPVVQMSGAIYAAWDGVTPATLLPEAVRLLRGTGYRGVVLSADLGAASFAGGTTPGDAAVDALNAGCDLLLLPGDARDQEQAVRAVVRAIRRGTVKPARVRQALARVEALRRAYGVK